MQETRRMRLQSAIQEELSLFVQKEVKDPRIPSVTFTEVQVTQDGSHATIFVSILGGALGGHHGADPLSDDEAAHRMKNCLEGLTAASGFIRRHLGKALTVRHIPSLIFREDRGFDNAARVHTLLEKLNREEGKSEKKEAKKPE